MIGLERCRKSGLKVKIISFFISVLFAVGVAGLTVPRASAAPASLKSPLSEPAATVVDNGDGSKTYTFYVLFCENGSSVSHLYENVVTTSSANQLVFRVGQQNTVVNGVQQNGSNVVTHYLVSSGSVVEVNSFTPIDLGNYFHVNNANYTFRFRAGYFPKQSALSTNCYVHAWAPDGVTFVNDASSYYVDDWVEWAVDPSENIFYSHLDKPIADTFNRYFVAYNRKTKDGLLIHFNIALNGVFEAMFDAVNTYNGYTVSGEGEIAVDDDFVNLEGYYGSTGNVYQGTISHNNNDELTVSFDVPGSSGSISAELNQLVDGRSFSPELDMSSGSEVWKLYQPSILYSTYGAIVCHYQIVVGIYSLLDGTLQSQYVFDSILGSQNEVVLDIGSPLAALHPTHILTFGTNYVPDLTAGYNWGAVQWSVDPVVTNWRNSVSSQLDDIISLLQQSGADEPTTINRDLASGLHEAENALTPKDENGNPIDVGEEAQKVFDDSLDELRELEPGIEFFQDSVDWLFEKPIVMLPVFVALTLGLLITIIGKNKQG